MKTRKNKKVDYVIAIPSYKRPDTLQEKTLSLLTKYKISPSKIYIFVASKEEESIYKDKIDSSTYNKIVVGVPKIGPQRNFISDYFPVGSYVVEMDDDIKGFIEYSRITKRNEKELGSLEKIIQLGFSECKKNNCSLWGIYPTPNGFFMKDTTDTDLRFIIGCFNGMINPGTKGTRGVKLELTVNKEDYERSIKFYLRDDHVIRMRSVAPDTYYYKEKGGNEEFRSKKTNMDEAKWLIKKFPQLAFLNLSRRSGNAEIRLKDKRIIN